MMHRGEDCSYLEALERARNTTPARIRFPAFTTKIDNNMLLLFHVFGYNERCQRKDDGRYQMIQSSWHTLQHVLENPQDHRALLAENESRLACVVMTLIRRVAYTSMQAGEPWVEWLVSPNSFRLDTPRGELPVYGSQRIYNWIDTHTQLLRQGLALYKLKVMALETETTASGKKYRVLSMQLVN